MTTVIESQTIPGPVRIVDVLDIDWPDGFARAANVDEQHRRLHYAMVSAIALPVAFASVLEDGEPVGFGLGVYERGMVGIFHVVVASQHRARGHGRSITRALLAWGHQAGARTAYLQVGEHNEIACQLYAGLGFSEACRDH